jgi:hypothetical protein
MTRESPSNQNQTGKPEPKTPMGGNQQVPQAAGNPRYNDPGLDPSPDPKIVVKAVNPPVTPDQVVGMAEMPSAATLDLPKIQNIKIPPVKNKTIQGHLKAIEAKMTATEKLMKDVVKLQKLQIITEKELFERKRELYQNTFEEYLLDKTVDFENPDDPGGANSIKKGPGGFGFPFGGRRRRKGRGPKGGGGTGAAGAAGAATTAAERMREGQASGLPNLGTDYKKQEQDAIKKAEEFRRQQEQKTGVPAKGKPAPDQDEAEAVPETPMVPDTAPLRVPRFPILDPKFVPPFVIPDVITAQGMPAGPPQVTIPGYDMRVKTHQQDLADAIETYIENNPGSEFEIKLGRGALVDTGHLIKKGSDGTVYIHEPLSEQQLQLLTAANILNLSQWMPVVPRGRTGTGRTVPGLSSPRRGGAPTNTRVPTNRQPARQADPVGAMSQPVRQPSRPALPPGQKGGDIVPAAQPKSSIVKFQRQQQQTGKKGGPLDTAGPTIDVNVSGTSKTGAGTGEVTSAPVGQTAPSSFRAAERAQYQSMTRKELERLIRRERIAQRKSLRKEPTESQKLQLEVLQEKYGMNDAVINQASGGMGDVELFSSDALNYFRGMSSKIVPQADGGLVGWWNKGRNMRVPFENTASWKDLMKDDAKQITRTNKAFKSGATGIKGWNPIKAFTPEMVRTGPTPAVRQAFERPVRTVTHPLMMALEFIVNDLLLNPRSTAVYDQVTGPNAYYNDPAYKGPMPSQNLENAQSSMMSGNDPKVEVKPLPPEYIKIPGKKKAPDFVGNESPDIQMRSSIFSRSSTHID